MSEPKKISFGFSKQTKKPNLFISKDSDLKESDSIQLIQYLEEKAIKIIGGAEKLAEPLVIPMREPNKKLVNLVDIVTNDFEVRAESEVVVEKIEDKNDSKLTLDELAAKELIQDLKSGKNSEDSNKVNVIPTTDKVTFEGEKESTLDDYDSVPITEFGKAMLRGMGWKDGLGIGKNQEIVKVAQPSIRPKGMGLGADKLTKQAKDNKPALDRDGKALACKKGAFVKIIAGYHKGNYGTIIGFDDESGRLNIKTALNKLNISLNEFLLIPVTRDEFNKNSKIINNAKYEEYIQKQKDKEKLEFAIKENSKLLKTEPLDSKEDRNSEIGVISSDSDEAQTRKIKSERKSKLSPDRKKYSSESDNGAYDKKRREKSRKRHERDEWRQRRNDESNSDEESKKSREKSRKSEKSRYESDGEEESKKSREKGRKSDKYSERPVKYENSEDESKKRRDKSRKGEKSKYDYDSGEESRKFRERGRKSELDKQGKSKYDTDSEEESKNSREKSRKNDEETEKNNRKKYRKKKYKSDESSDESKYKRNSKKNYEDDYKHRETRTDKDRVRERSRRDNRR